MLASIVGTLNCFYIRFYGENCINMTYVELVDIIILVAHGGGE